jgi:hypothetical protein
MQRLLAALLVAFAVPAAAQSVAVATHGGHGRGHSAATVTVAMGHPARFNRWSVRPVEVLEDSRCPRYVSCVWRGRLTVRLLVDGKQSLSLENGKPVPFGGGTLTLLDATPLSARGEKVPPTHYRFTLRFET